MRKYRNPIRKEATMFGFFSVLGIACFAVAALVLTTATTIGASEVILAGIFGFIAFVSAFIVGVLGMAKYGRKKICNKVNSFREWRKSRKLSS